MSHVALRKESVDRNYQANAVDQILPGSLSARRAWIEMDAENRKRLDTIVALRKESVDRNMYPMVSLDTCSRRSPQGERG